MTMNIKLQELPGSKVELKFIISTEEAKPFIDEAVKEASLHKSIPGFRPGKAPKDEVIKALGGEMSLLQLALEKIVQSFYVQAVLDKKLQTIGSPEVSVDQLTPGQDVKFTCTAAVMPKVNKMFDVEKTFVSIKKVEVSDADLQKQIEDLRKVRRQEVISDKVSKKVGMIDIDMEMKKDNVLLEGGKAVGYKVYLQEEHYIPKFSEQLVGLKKGEKKKFSLPFPKDHFQKVYAGSDIDFEITVNEVYDIILPDVNDDFAKALGLKDVEQMKDLLKNNLTLEKQRKALESAEIELLETVVEKTTFTEVPEILIKEEVRRMFEEIRRDIESRGGKMDDYLSSLKKTPDELRLEMVPQAIKRVKTAVYITEFAKKYGLEASSEEIDKEVDHALSHAQKKEDKDYVSSPQYREYVEVTLRNRKTLDELKKKGIKDYQKFLDDLAARENQGQEAHSHEHNHDDEKGKNVDDEKDVKKDDKE